MSVKEKQQPINFDDEKLTNLKKLILYNDDFNTFDFVIETLKEVCGHNAFQAETCAWIAHYKGNCVVKKGVYDRLKPCCDQLSFNNLIVEIQ